MKRTTFSIALLALLLLAGYETGGMAQSMVQVRREPFPGSRSESGAPPFGPSRGLKMLKESFEQTQKDTTQLHEMVTELKAEMDNTNEDVLSITVMKKAEAIEKLAEKIKNRMKNL